jgi:hypothetical protein
LFYHRFVGRGRDRSGGSNREHDRLLLAEVAGVSARHVPLSGLYPYGEAAAIAEVRSAAGDRAGLLAEFAGVRLGLSVTHPVDQIAEFILHASLAAKAGADMDAVGRWITVGLKRGGDILASRQPRP